MAEKLSAGESVHRLFEICFEMNILPWDMKNSETCCRSLSDLVKENWQHAYTEQNVQLCQVT